ncbi:MAG: DNA gyrase subunit A [Anaerolineales bacterium]|nr:DNA gyrase subunit A [Anaerolineales bacterium]
MEVGLVRRIDIDTEMQQSYLDYAMSVIVSRALPDARDGLKPVHRRILHAMHAMGVRSETGFKKSARIVGEVLGKFHPHGDMAVYDAMARMAQEFSMRYPLIEGQGNFGSVDGDPPAAMRYTEARLAALSAEMMGDIEKDTVDFDENFDGSLQEPTVLPAGFPNLLVNGATGIAVGMSTSIPPHNMAEICDALIFMLENWSRMDAISLDDMMKFVKGPDFPTGGIILHGGDKGQDLAAAYGSGRGKITLQARAHIEEMGRGRSRIIVTELPYQTNKSNLIERIADLARSGQLEGLADLRDESDRQGMRIVLELSKTAEPQKLLAELYRRTPMQTTFSLIMLALVDGEPRLLGLKQALRVYLEHRLEVIRKRSEFELARARERAHILAGLRIALQNIDQVIEMIRTAKDVPQAKSRLIRRLKLSEEQATAILDMPLRRLSGLERRKIEKEYKDVMARIKELEALLRSSKKMRSLIAQELTQIKATYGDRRNSQIVETGVGRRARSVLTATDLAPAKETWVSIRRDGLVARTPTARIPRLGGRGAPRLVIGASVRDTLYLFDTKGFAAALPVHTLPECDDLKDGVSIAGITPFEPEDEIVAGIALPPEKVGTDGSDGFLVFCTQQGMVKKTSLQVLPGPSARTFQAVKIGQDDKLGWVSLTRGDDDICITTSFGMAIRFSESEVRPMGLSAAGVLGVRMGEDQRVVGMGVVQPRSDLFLITQNGLAKRSAMSQFPRQGRYGKGVLAWKSGEEVHLAGAIMGQPDDRAIAHVARGAARSIRFSNAPRRVRTGGGKLLFEVKEGNRVTALSPVIKKPTFKTQPKQPPESKAKSTAETRKRSPKSTPSRSRRSSKSGSKKS